MSAYINFYVRHNDIFVPIGSYCRSSVLYSAFDTYAPYERIAPVSERNLIDVKNEFQNVIAHFNDKIDQLNEQIEYTGKFNNNIDEKLEAIGDLQAEIEDYAKERKEVENAMVIVDYWFHGLVEDRNIAIKYREYEGLGEENHFLYCGIETSYFPTIADIAE